MHKYQGIKPTGNRVLVERLNPETKTKGGIFVPAQHSGEYQHQGIVRAIGPGNVTKMGKRIPMPPIYGERVMLDPTRGSNFKAKGVRYSIVPEHEILAIIKGKKAQQ